MGRERVQRVVLQPYVDRSMRRQLRLFLGIFAVVAAVAVIQVVRDGVNPLWALAGFFVGLGIGAILARAKVLGWDPSQQVVVGTTDVLGAVILVAYVLFLVFRKRLLGHEIHDANVVGVVGLAMTGGVMLGRVSLMLRGIRRLLAGAGVWSADAPSPQSEA